MTSFRPSKSDLVRLKAPLGKLLPGTPTETMPKLHVLVLQIKPSRITAVGDIVSRETLATGIRVNLRIVDQMTLRKRINPLEIKAERLYRVRNPAGVITEEAWDAIRQASQDNEAVIVVDGEEDLLAIPAIIESPDDGLVIYGQPSEGVVAVVASPEMKKEAGKMMERMTQE